MKAAIISFPGTTGEQDIQEALLSVGFEAGDVEIVDERQTELSTYDVVFLPGGASYGDSIRPGAAAKVDAAAEAVVQYAATGKPLIGIGNGFQLLTELGLLPGGFLKNKTLKTVNGLYEVKVESSRTVFTNQLEEGQTLRLPIAHKYGQYTADEETLARLKENKQIVLTYSTENPNGSAADIAGITNESGTIIGIMPKPERAMNELFGSADGNLFFQSIKSGATEHAERNKR